MESLQLTGASPLLHSTKKKPKKRDTSAEDNFAFQCRAMKLPLFEREAWIPRSDGSLTPKTQVPQGWKFDFGFPAYKLYVEIDGGIWMPGGGAHSHPVDVTRNMTKRNDAQLAGWGLLAFTPAEVKSGHAINVTQTALALRGWKGAK